MNNILKNKVFLSFIVAGVGFSAVYFGGFWRPGAEVEPQLVESPSQPPPEPTGTNSTRVPQQTGNIGTGAVVPLPTGDGRTTFIEEPVPWHLLLGQASCQLKGEIKFLDHNTYNNQDALFVYTGVDHPARTVVWTVTPQDDISVGPNILNKTPIPDGESLLGIVLPDNPKYKKYELTAKINYGRLVDDKGNFVTVGGYVKVFEKQCDGKTTIIIPNF